MEDAAPDTQPQSLPDSKVANDGQKKPTVFRWSFQQKKGGMDNAKNVECLTVAPAETRRNLEVLAN